MVEVVGRIPLQQASLVDDADLIGERERLVLIVRHEQSRHLALRENFAHVLTDALAKIRIEARERLVEQYGLGLRRKRAGERDALLLPPGELVDEAAGDAVETHHIEQLIHHRTPLGMGLAAQTEGNVAFHR